MPDSRAGPATRAQTEVIGFVLTFGIIVLAVGVVTASGYAGLQHAQQAEQVDNAAVAFQVLAANVDDLVQAGVPSRSTELKLSAAQLSLGDPVTVNVTVTSLADPNRTVSYALASRPIVYDARTGSTVVYSSGAVIRVDRGGVVLLRKPGWTLAADRTTLPIVELRARGPTSVGGSTQVQVRTTRAEAPLLVSEPSPQRVTVAVTSPRATAWERYLRPRVDAAGGTCTAGAGTVSCTFDTQRVHVVAVRTDVTFR